VPYIPRAPALARRPRGRAETGQRTGLTGILFLLLTAIQM